MRDDPDRGDVLSVGELTRRVRGLLEGAYPSVWVEGEISNYTAHGSGHWYFTLKDADASLSCAMFRGHNRRVRFDPEHGMAVRCQGRISVYPPRGNYQLIVERMEPQGQGALQIAFEQLRRKLEAEGLFAAQRKRPLPSLPVRIGIVTSPTGAALRDMLRVLGERFEPLEVLLAPARVQGHGAAAEISAALDLLDRDGHAQVVLCGRGGGSLEDLWAFNEEQVARAIARCSIPVISAVGHEVDVTIADLVADVRAATPSNAAEIAVPVRAELDALRRDLDGRLMAAWYRTAQREQERLGSLRARLIDPRRHLQIQAQRRDELEARLARAGRQRVERVRGRVDEAAGRLVRAGRHRVQIVAGSLGAVTARLDALSPLAVLGRGYAIAFDGERVVRDAAAMAPGDALRLRLHRGALSCTVDAIHAEEDAG